MEREYYGRGGGRSGGGGRYGGDQRPPGMGRGGPTYGDQRPNAGRGRPGYTGRGGPSYGDQRPVMGRGGPSYGDQRPLTGRGGPGYGDQRPPQQNTGRGGPAYGDQRPPQQNTGRGGPAYGDQRPPQQNTGRGGPAYGDQRPLQESMGRGGPVYGEQRPTQQNTGRGGPAYGDQRPPQQNMGRGGPGYGDQRPPQQSMGRGGYGDQRPHMGRGGPNYGGPQQTMGRGFGGGDGGRGSSPYGGRGGQGRGPPHQQQPQRPYQAMPEIQRLRITGNLPVPSSPKDATTNLSPVKRPDGGGTITIRSPSLFVNHFPVKFNANSTIIHYDIDIKLESPPKGRSSKIIKSELRLIKNKLFSENEFPPSRTAYDGEKNIYSAVELPTGTYKVDFSIAEDRMGSTYLVSIKEVNRLKLSKLKDYLEGKVLLVPREVLHGMDLVMKENPSQCRISLGRCYFPFNNTGEDDLRWGITASKGYQHSLKSTSQGLAMCLDYTVLAFRKPLGVIDFLLEHFPGCRGDVRQIPLNKILGALKGLKVYVTHRPTKQKFTVTRFTDKNTRNSSFDIVEPEGVREVGVVEYYMEKYGKEIVHLDIPCFDFGKNNRKNYVPMEFCVLVEGQRFPKEGLDGNAQRSLKNLSLVKPLIRRNAISEMVNADDGPSGGDVSKNFGLQVVKEMTQVEARVIGPPQLKIGGRGGLVNVDRDKCQWNLVGKSVVEGKSLERWAVVDFSSADGGRLRLDPNRFVNNIRNRCQSLGMHVEAPLVYRNADMSILSNINALEKLLKSVVAEANEKHGKDPLQMMVCPMSCQDPGYKTLKFLSETKIGVVTQCVLSDRANEGKDQYLANLAIKINAKLGGSNMELTHEFTAFPGEGPVMFIGADVNHPSPNANPFSRSREDAPPSIAAIVGTVNWPAANRYAARVSPQYGRTEKIVKFGEMCKELIEAYAEINNDVKPQRIIVFRDGVSEGQFEMVLNEELFDLKNSIYDENYRPTITLVVAQKRHQTRLFPMRQEDGGPTGNVPPGTVVDTVITHPFEFDFYLNSHFGGIGTSKPTHYYVLYDDHNFTSDLIQQLCYDLCFTFARCTKPVSLVPPVYYADLVAYRGRMFQEAGANIGPSSSSRSVVSSSSNSTSLDEKLYKLHPELENKMFFV